MRLRRRVLTGCDESSWTFSTDRRPQTADRRRRPPLWTVDDNGGGVSMRSAAGTVRTIARPQAARVALLGSRSYRIGSDRLRFDLRRRSPMDGAARFAHSLDHEEQNGSHVGVVKKWPPRHPQPRQLRPIYRTLLHFDIRPRPLAPQPKINLALLRPSIALVRDRVLYSVLVSSQHTRAPSFSLASPRLVSPITQLSPHPSNFSPRRPSLRPPARSFAFILFYSPPPTLRLFRFLFHASSTRSVEFYYEREGAGSEYFTANAE